jgi:hypothetical protein
MSRINGEKSRANLQKRRRTMQRLKDRTDREAVAAAKPAPVAEAAPAKKSSKRGA